MDVEAWRDAIELFDELEDPRVAGRCKHLLTDIVMIALVALIGPCEEWDDVEQFGKAYEDWFRQFLELSNGIPSHIPGATRSAGCSGCWTRRRCRRASRRG